MAFREWFLKDAWFSDDTPTNAKNASISIGDGDDGVITVVYDEKGTDGNDYSLEVVVPDKTSADLAAALNGTKITVSLATDSDKLADDTKNTAKLIEGAINTLSGFTAKASGTGATAISAAITEEDFDGGQFATPCLEESSIIKGSNYYYICVTPGDRLSAKWQRFSLADY